MMEAPISLAQNSNNDEEDEGCRMIIKEEISPGHCHQRREIIQKETLFEKPLTPSDVGKLNRLVIPKQHAEKYFPTHQIKDPLEKGLILSFEDELGKTWRFRYSYWSSSQSYVLTKGWSRFVKEKSLDAGDVVVFERHGMDGHRYFIGWRRRSAAGQESGAAQLGMVAAGGGFTRLLLSGKPYPTQTHGPAVPYLPDRFHPGSANSSSQPQDTKVVWCGLGVPARGRSWVGFVGVEPRSIQLPESLAVLSPS